MGKQDAVQPYCRVLFSRAKEGSTDTGFRVDGPWKHDTRWQKPDTNTVVVTMGRGEGGGRKDWQLTALQVQGFQLGDGNILVLVLQHWMY